MRITPEEIVNKEFRKTVRGYKYIEVDRILDELAEKHEVICSENQKLKEKVGFLKEKIDYYKRMEENIQKTLILAQNSTEQIKEVATGEAELIVKNASSYSKNLMENAKKDLNNISEDFESVKQKFHKFRDGHKTFMKTQIDMFKDLEKDLINENKNIENDKLYSCFEKLDFIDEDNIKK